MSVTKNQDYFEVNLGTFVAGVPRSVTLPRPRTLPGFTNNIDHVINPPSRREWEGGMVKIFLDGIPTDLADLLLTEVAFVLDPINPLTDAPEPAGSATEPLFPSGAATGTPRVAFTAPAGVAFGTTPAASLTAFLENLMVEGEESVRLTLLSPGGGEGGTLRVTYELGLNNADPFLRASN